MSSINMCGSETVDRGVSRVDLSWYSKTQSVVDMTAAIFDQSDQHLISASIRVTLPVSANSATDTEREWWLSTVKDSLIVMVWNLWSCSNRINRPANTPSKT